MSCSYIGKTLAALEQTTADLLMPPECLVIRSLVLGVRQHLLQHRNRSLRSTSHM